MSTGIFGGTYVMITWLPTYLRTALNLSIATSAGYRAMNIIGSLVGPLCYGWLSDRIGRCPAFMTFLLLQAGNVAIDLLAPIGAKVTMSLSFILGAFQGALASGMLPTSPSCFRQISGRAARASAWASARSCPQPLEYWRDAAARHCDGGVRTVLVCRGLRGRDRPARDERNGSARKRAGGQTINSS